MSIGDGQIKLDLLRDFIGQVPDSFRFTCFELWEITHWAIIAKVPFRLPSFF